MHKTDNTREITNPVHQGHKSYIKQSIADQIEIEDQTEEHPHQRLPPDIDIPLNEVVPGAPYAGGGVELGD